MEKVSQTVGRGFESLPACRLHLATHPKKAVPHRELLQAVWGRDSSDELEYLRVFVNLLKIEPQPSWPNYLLTARWVGYSFRLPEQNQRNP